MIKIPPNNQWTQPNTSYKMGSLWYTKNIDLSEAGIIKMSPRMVNIFDDSANTTNIGDTDFSTPVAFGRYSEGSFYIATRDEPFNLVVSESAKTIAEDSSSSNPNLVSTSHGCWWQNRWYESTDTAVYYNASGTWTADAITGLTSGKRHYMTVFRNKNLLAVSDANTVKLYNTSHTNTITLTLPSDYEVIGLVYNNYTLGIITRMGSDSTGQNSDAYFFVWDGSSSEADAGVSVGSYTSISVAAYKSSFVVVTSEGQLLYWNGGGFDELASFPFYSQNIRIENFLNFQSYGDSMIVDGDNIYMNVSFDFDSAGTKGESYLQNNPAGIWCYDPKVGLYHKWSLSNSKAYFHSIAQADINTTTNIITTAQPIPATGNPVVLTNTSSIGGVTARKQYYIIKLSSTTFSLAETKALADAGTKVDITSADTTNYFWLYDIIDYGISYASTTGALSLWGGTRSSYTDIMAGGNIYHTDNTTQHTLCTAVPLLDGVSYFVTSKIFTDSATEEIPSLFVKHRQLKTNDSIIVKIKTRDYLGMPVSTPTPDSLIATWSSSTVFSTGADLSEAKTIFEAGEELELELTSGVGAGQLVKITDLTGSAGAYTVTVADTIVGASSNLKSNFIIDNWTVCASIDSSNQSPDGVFEVLVGKNSRSPQFKVELRGNLTSIEHMFINNKTHKSGV